MMPNISNWGDTEYRCLRCKHNYPISLSVLYGFQYCPYCGKRFRAEPIPIAELFLEEVIK